MSTTGSFRTIEVEKTLPEMPLANLLLVARKGYGLGVSDVESKASRGYGMIHDEDEDNDAYYDDEDDDKRSWEEDGEWICFLGGNNSSGTKKYQGSNSSVVDIRRWSQKSIGGVIESCGEIEFSEELKEVFPDEAREIIR
ncbi:hypothetical protein Tco_1104026 [Tanacetum coccineum]